MFKLALIAGVSASVLQKQPFDMTSGGDNSCYLPKKAKAYRGLQDSTKSGRKCQNWTAVKPHSGAGETAKNAASDAGLGNHSYCRAPTADFPAPWCYTQDPALEKEECSIPECKAEGAFARNFPNEAKDTALKIGSKDCECADQLYGATTTTKDTSVPGASFLQKNTKCTC